MKKKSVLFLMCLFILMMTSWELKAGAENTELSLTSPMFQHQGMIPTYCKFNKENRSPALEWKNPPEGTKSYYLECQDLDVTWTHWIIYNIPVTYTGLPENIPAKSILPDGLVQKQNSFGTMGWGGPSPPSGTHRYEFTLIALDIETLDSPKLSVIKKHTLGKAKLIGLSN